jgi:hypothetical protein
MRRRLIPLFLTVASGATLAQGGDPLKSAECLQALDALQAREAALPSASPPAQARAGAAELAALAPYRKRVARECLGKEDPALERAPRVPISVSPVGSPPSAIPHAPAAVPPPVPIPPLRTVTQCDPSGCWTSDGIRLNRMGPVLVGPLGACTVQSGVLSCR